MLSRFFDFDHDLATSLSLMNAFDRRYPRGYAEPPRALPRAGRFSELTLTDDGDHLTFTATMPGVPRDDVEVTIEGKVLSVKAKAKVEATKEAKAPEPGREPVLFHKHVDVGVAIDGEAVTAKLEDGILTVTLPKASAAKPRKIPIGKAEPPPAQA